MTWATLWNLRKDPLAVCALILMVCGEVQAQSDALLSWLGPVWAGRVLSSIGFIALLMRWVSSLPRHTPEEAVRLFREAEAARLKGDGGDHA